MVFPADVSVLDILVKGDGTPLGKVLAHRPSRYCICDQLLRYRNYIGEVKKGHEFDAADVSMIR